MGRIDFSPKKFKLSTMKRFWIILASILLLLSPTSARADAPPHSIILFIGDGMGADQRTAVQWASVGQNGQLVMDNLPFAGWSQTANRTGGLTDSAAGGTAIATGTRTDNGIISQTFDGQNLTTILELAQARGMSVGLVTTTQLAHATPAVFAAHVPSRSMMTEIARQEIAAGVDVLLGGGEDDFLPTAATGCYGGAGNRTDGRNLITEAQSAGYATVCTAAELSALDTAHTPKLLGAFADDGMTRPFSPTLAEMTIAALDVLGQNPNGYFLMVEGGQIDWAGHANDAANVIGDTLGLDTAIAAALAHSAVDAGHTLVIVTADHETGGMSLSLTDNGGTQFSMPDSTPFWVTFSTNHHTAVDVPATATGHCSNFVSGTFPNTDIFSAMKRALDPCLSVSITGNMLGTPADTFTLTTAISPATTIRPLTLTWQADGFAPVTRTGTLTDSQMFQWALTGTHAVTVTVQNPGDTLTSPRSVVVTDRIFPVYLPLILK